MLCFHRLGGTDSVAQTLPQTLCHRAKDPTLGLAGPSAPLASAAGTRGPSWPWLPSSPGAGPPSSMCNGHGQWALELLKTDYDTTIFWRLTTMGSFDHYQQLL